MSFSSALQSLRLPAARSVVTRQLCRVAPVAPSSGSRASSSSSNSSSTSRPHAPHGHVDQGIAGPSRCFCTSHRRAKASELPLEELHYQSSLDSYRPDQLPTTSDFWQPHESSSRSLAPATRKQPRHAQHHNLESAPSIRALFLDSHSEHLQNDATSCNDFFTPSVRQRTGPEVANSEPPPATESNTAASIPPPTYIDSLSPERRNALEDRVRLLLRSGEHSMPALCADFRDCSAHEREQICCHILSQCIKEAQDARVVWDLCRSWPSTQDDVAEAGPARTMLRRMQGDTLYRCVNYLHAAGLTRQAAMLIGDVRLRTSQSRYLLERLIYEFKLPSTLNAKRHDSTDLSTPTLPPSSTTATSFAAADARIAVREMCDAMTGLLADGVSFKRRVVNRMLKLLCLTKARSRVVRLMRAAQRRAQIEALSADAGRHGGLRAAGGFSRLRADEVKPPQVVSTKTMEEAMRVLCGQDSTGARVAYELLCVLDAAHRTPAMYDVLMTRYGNAATALPESDGGYRTVDEQLWQDILDRGGPTLHTISARIACHTRKRRLDLIRSDLALARSLRLGGMHDLSAPAQLGIVRCAIEAGCLLAGFRYASSLISASRDAAFHSHVVTTLLRAAQHIHLAPAPAPASSTPSRAQLLKRFMRHFSHLHAKHAELRTGVRELELFVALMETHQAWIETATLWNMLRVVGGHLGGGDARVGAVLEAFGRVFDARGERESAREIRGLIGRLSAEK
ncbi:conserved hypothetical protein [Sporisorium reilianum SRZ2]|uniref:Uncharacterized protein n=1 Tax=Sporisorium reilianum (strain SRZ2) TaxID=999809 RepID=E6ZVL2_SPORE|nr:conserved hypothetical protein [Sporisorium reilianum SRZ2]